MHGAEAGKTNANPQSLDLVQLGFLKDMNNGNSHELTELSLLGSRRSLWPGLHTEGLLLAVH